MELSDRLLLTALRYRIEGTDRDAGMTRLRAVLGDAADEAAIASMLARHVAAGLLHDPVRLEPGALQCHWRLELTPSGYAAIQGLLPRPDGG